MATIKKTRNKNAQGFSLIELLITIAIVAILAAIAIPAYQSQITKARRADAQAALIGLAQAMERHNSNTNSYAGATLGNGSVDTDIYPATSPVGGPAIFYNLSITYPNLNPPDYLLTATPVNAQVGDGILTYSSTGLKQWDSDGSGGAIGANENCWEKAC